MDYLAIRNRQHFEVSTRLRPHSTISWMGRPSTDLCKTIDSKVAMVFENDFGPLIEAAIGRLQTRRSWIINSKLGDGEARPQSRWRFPNSRGRDPPRVRGPRSRHSNRSGRMYLELTSRMSTIDEEEPGSPISQTTFLRSVIKVKASTKSKLSTGPRTVYSMQGFTRIRLRQTSRQLSQCQIHPTCNRALQVWQALTALDKAAISVEPFSFTCCSSCRSMEPFPLTRPEWSTIVKV